jgi:ubiquitin-like protein ATG12
LGTPADNNNAIPDSTSHDPDLPLTMASSMILTSLPRDAATALSTAAEFPRPKVTVLFKAVGGAPVLKRTVCQISSTQRFEVVVSYLRKVLKVGAMDSVFLYVNSSFAPALDEIVGNLHRVSGILSLQKSLWHGRVTDFGIVFQRFQ